MTEYGLRSKAAARVTVSQVTFFSEEHASMRAYPIAHSTPSHFENDVARPGWRSLSRPWPLPRLEEDAHARERPRRTPR